ncbi:Alpha/Beta hydrolase protein [Cubamyces lactineus]|nr:Alpha/Beta hydrolase protein [Cubamyces lactineus]
MATPSGLSVLSDSGAPKGCTNYQTIVVIHGYVWHGGIFSKLLPLADRQGVRVILLNRREYPGSTPYTAEERALLPSVTDKPPTDDTVIRSATEMLETFMQQRARELYECLQTLVMDRSIPPIRSGTEPSGIILVGWSLGAMWMTALLSHVAHFPVDKVNLRDYMRRIVLFDPPACLLGYPYPEQDPYNPFYDTSLTYEERGRFFTNWITSYFSHGDTLETFERRRASQVPPPTLASMSAEDFQSTVHVPPGVPGGSDWMLLHGCFMFDIFSKLRLGAFFLSPGQNGEAATRPIGDEWRDVEVHYIWGDHSIWEAPYCAMMMRQEIDMAEKEEPQLRPITIQRLKGANHFAQWDYPTETLEAFLTNKSNVQT